MTELIVGRVGDTETREQWHRAQRFMQYFHEDFAGGRMGAITTAFDDTTTFHNIAAGTGGDAATEVGMDGFVKRGGASETYLMFNYGFEFFVDVATEGILTRVLATHNGGTTFASDKAYLISQRPANTRNTFIAWDGTKTKSLPAGTYNLKIQYRFDTAGVYNFRSDGNDPWTLMVREWPADKAHAPTPTGTEA